MMELAHYDRFLQTLKPKSTGLLFFGVRLCEDPDRGPVLKAQLQEKLPEGVLDIVERYGGLYVTAVRSTAFVQPRQTLVELDVWDRMNEREDWEAEIIKFFEKCRMSAPNSYEMGWYLGVDAEAGPTFIKLMVE